MIRLVLCAILMTLLARTDAIAAARSPLIHAPKPEMLASPVQQRPTTPNSRPQTRGKGGGGKRPGLKGLLRVPLILEFAPRRPGRHTRPDRPAAEKPKRRPIRKPKVYVAPVPPRTAPKPPRIADKPQKPQRAKAATPPPAAPPRSRSVQSPPPPVPRAVAALFQDKPHRPREIMALVATDGADQTRLALMRDYNLIADEARTLSLLGAALLRLRLPDNRPLDDVVAALRTDARVLSVQPNYVYELLKDGKTAPATERIQYNLAALRIPEAHAIATGRDVPIAVIDTCVDDAHPELQGAIAEGFDAADGADATARCGRGGAHGTAIAGVIAARQTLQGVAPRARLFAAGAFTALDEGAVKPQATTWALALAVDWAAAKGARIFNMSFAGPEDPLLGRLVGKVFEGGALIVAAAGNAGPSAPPAYPAAYPGVLAVTAVDAERKLYQPANRGDYVSVAAPGVDILVPVPEGSYDTASGTSYAAAHISGIAALLLEREPGLAQDVLRNRLLATAADLGEAGRDDDFGAGLADAQAALLALTPAKSASQQRAP